MYEPENGSFRELVFDDSILLSIEIAQALAGERFVALVVRLPKGQGNEVRVFDIGAAGQSAPVYTRRFPDPVTVAWRGPNEILLVQPGQNPEAVRIQDR